MLGSRPKTKVETEPAKKVATSFKELGKASNCSRFPVGSVVVGTNGKMYPGVNVENAAYGNTICAERTAIGTAVTDGTTEIKTVFVSTNTPTNQWPCGACRQSIAEFASLDCEVVSIRADGGCELVTFDQLLPHGFKAKDLEIVN